MKSLFRLNGIFPFSIIASTLCLTSCALTDMPVMSVFQDFNGEGVPSGIVFDFSPSPEDSASLSSHPCDIILKLRYTNRCKSRNVIFNVEQNSLAHEQPDSSKVVFHLFSPYGKPLGIGNYGVYELSDTIRRHYQVPEGYVVSLTSPLPVSATIGIQSIGLIIE